MVGDSVGVHRDGVPGRVVDEPVFPSLPWWEGREWKQHGAK
jgi:hypothetical protein